MKKNSAKQIVKIVDAAARFCGVNVDVEVTYSNVEFERSTFDKNNTPIIIIDDFVEFSGEVPPVNLIRRKLDNIKRLQGDMGPS